MLGKHVRALAAMIRADATSFQNAAWINDLEEAGAPADLLLIARAAAAGRPAHLGPWVIDPGGVDEAHAYLEDNELNGEEVDEEHRASFAGNAGGLAVIAAFDTGADETWLYLADPDYGACRMLDSIETWLQGVAGGDDRAGNTSLEGSANVAELARRVRELPAEPGDEELGWIDGSAGTD